MGNYDDQLRLALDYLVKTQNADGGWGYRPGGQSFTECTAMALLALFHPALGVARLNAPQSYVEAVQKGLVRLRNDQHQDGGWGVFKDDAFSGWMTYPATWVFNVMLKIPELAAQFTIPEDVAARSRARGYILNKAREPAVSQRDYEIYKKILNIDSNILGWKWGPNPNEAGFVIPTSLAIIALTVEDRATVADSDQVREGKAYLRDRACDGGGWNVGNPYMFDKKLPPTPDGTAYALLAFSVSLGASDFGDTRVIWRGVSVLSDFVEDSYSDQTVALGLLALRFFPDVGTNSQERLRRLYNKLLTGAAASTAKPKITGQAKTGGWADSPLATSYAVLALSDDLYFLQPK